jgi:hypothetical protein
MQQFGIRRLLITKQIADELLFRQQFFDDLSRLSRSLLV